MAGAAAADKPRELRVPVIADSEAPLSLKDLKVEIGGAGPARVTRLRGPKDDLLLMVIFDLTGDLSLVDPAKEALCEHLTGISPKTYVSLLRAQDGLQVILDPTTDKEAQATTIQNLPVTGKSALLNTVETAVHLAESIAAKSTVRVAILYLTDSRVQNYREDFTNPVINSSDSRDLSRRFPEGLIREKISKLEEIVTRHQTPVSVVHLDYQTDRLNEAYQSGLIQLTAATGGMNVFCRSRGEISGAIENAIATIGSQYVVSVQLPAKTPRIVTVQLASGDRQLSYRNRFVLR